jgi:predicted transcriptional regulator of viral defense system
MAQNTTNQIGYTFNNTVIDNVCCLMYNYHVNYSFRVALQNFGSRYQIRKALAEGRLYVIGHGLYSDKKPIKDEATLSLLYPGAILTLNSAFYLYGLTDVVPDRCYFASVRTYTRIKDKAIKQNFQNKEIFILGDSSISTPSGTVRIYDKERLLIELIRLQKRFPYDYYKEIILNYRAIADSLDSNKIAEYAGHFKNGERILRQILREVF